VTHDTRGTEGLVYAGFPPSPATMTHPPSTARRKPWMRLGKEATYLRWRPTAYRLQRWRVPGFPSSWKSSWAAPARAKIRQSALGRCDKPKARVRLDGARQGKGKGGTERGIPACVRACVRACGRGCVRACVPARHAMLSVIRGRAESGFESFGPGIGCRCLRLLGAGMMYR